MQRDRPLGIGPRGSGAPGQRPPPPPFGSTPEPSVCGGQERVKCLVINKNSGFPGWVAIFGLPGCRLGVHDAAGRSGAGEAREFVQIEMIAVDRLIPYVRNARTHSGDQIAQIAASIAEFGFANPILVGEDNVIIAGHGRLLAARSLGLPDVPVIVLDHLSEAQRRALVIADNRIAENAGWDEQMLAAEINALRDEDFDLDVIGFSDAEIDDLFIGLGDESGSDGDGEFDGGGGGSVHGGGAGTSAPAAAPSATLAERFGIPPFSVLDARKGWWQDRKRAWLDMGIRSEFGRGEGERACPGGSVMPGQGTRKDYQPGAAKAFNDGAVLGKGGLADQVAAAATARRAKKEASNG